MLTIKEVRGGHFRLAAALATVLVVAAIGLLSSGSPQKSDRAAVGQAPVGIGSQTGSSAKAQTTAAKPHVVGPLRNIRPQKPVWHGNKNVEKNEAGYPLRTLPGEGRDTVVQRSAPGPRVPAPLLTFEGINNINGVLPPDTNGDVGPDHYMQWVNLSFAMYDKTNGDLVAGPFPGNTLFTGLAHCGSQNAGDPVVLYDQFAGRWLGSQFTGDNYMCIAISSTSDPTGSWCAYEFLPNPAEFPDYPKFGVWPSQNAYMMTATQFSNTFDGFALVGYERDRMLACQTARMVYQNMYDIDPNLPFIMPADADGDTPPPDGAPAPIVVLNFDGTGLPEDQLQVWNATIDWNAPSISVVHDTDLQAAPFDSNLCDYERNCIPQPGTTRKLDTLSNRLMHRVQYRNFGGWETMVTSQSVDTGNDHAGVRWYHLENIGGAGWGIRDQGTYAPDAVNRWMPSAAMDKSGDIAVGYSASDGTSVFPSVRYSGRLASDPRSDDHGRHRQPDPCGEPMGGLLDDGRRSD